MCWVIREGSVVLQLVICCYTDLLLHVEKGGHECSCFGTRILQICVSVIAQAALL